MSQPHSLYWIGLYESVCSKKWEWFFQVDLTRAICYGVLRFMRGGREDLRFRCVAVTDIDGPKILVLGVLFAIWGTLANTSLSTGTNASGPRPLKLLMTMPVPVLTNTAASVPYHSGLSSPNIVEDESYSPDDPNDAKQVSHSLAQQRLAALAAAKPSRRQASDSQVPIMSQTSAMTTATALNHPWNLLAPVPPTTPRAARKQMLAMELSESLRRNLLWARQVNKTNLLRNARNEPGGGSRQVTTVVSGDENAQAGPSQQQQQQQQQQWQQQQHGHQRSQGSGDGAQDSIDERRQRALARNRTWADDFHYTGW